MTTTQKAGFITTFSAFLGVFRPMRMSLLVLGLGGFVMLQVDQAKDILLGLEAEVSEEKDYGHSVVFGLAIWLWAYAIWYGASYARVFWRAPEDVGEGLGKFADKMPARLGWAALLTASGALWLAGAKILAGYSLALLSLPILYLILRRRQKGKKPGLLDLLFVPWVGDKGTHLSSLGRDIAIISGVLMLAMGIAVVVFADKTHTSAIFVILAIYAVAIWRVFAAKMESHDRWLIGFVFALSGGLHIWIVLNPVAAGQTIGPAAIFLIAIASWVPFGTQLAVWSEKDRLPVFTLIGLLAFIFSFWNDNHAVRTMDSPQAPVSRPTIAQAYAEWMTRPSCKNKIPVIVAAEGGGIRAAYWTGQVLAELSDKRPDFAECLFAISGVSGGSLGAVVYRVLGDDSSKVTPARVEDALKHDFLGPAFASMFYPDLLQRILPFPLMPDRAEAMELAWEAGIKDGIGFAGRFQDLVGEAGKRKFPLLFLNGSAVHKGGRIVTATAEIESPSGIYQDLLHDFRADIRISTAVSSSARFPVVSPAGTLISPTKYSEQVVDGGYYENNGALTVADIIDALPSPQSGEPPKVIVIQILNSMDKPVSHIQRGIVQSLQELESQCVRNTLPSKLKTETRLCNISNSCKKMTETGKHWLSRDRGGDLDLALEKTGSACFQRFDAELKAKQAQMMITCERRDEFTGGYSGEVMAVINALMAARSSHGKQADDSLRRLRFNVDYTAIDLFATVPAEWDEECAKAVPPLGWVLSKAARKNMNCQSKMQTLCAQQLLAGTTLSGCGWDETQRCVANKGECIGR